MTLDPLFLFLFFIIYLEIFFFIFDTDCFQFKIKFSSFVKKKLYLFVYQIKKILVFKVLIIVNPLV